MSLYHLSAFALKCLGNDLFLGAGTEQKHSMRAIFQNPDRNTHFRLDAAGHGESKLFCFYHSSHVSGYGYTVDRGKPGPGWALRPGVADEPWSRFAVQLQGDGPDDWIIQIRSTSPAAASSPWVQVIGPSRLAAISKASPEHPWAYFKVVPVTI